MTDHRWNESFLHAIYKESGTYGFVLEGRFFQLALEYAGGCVVKAAEFASCDGALSMNKQPLGDTYTDIFFTKYREFLRGRNRRGGEVEKSFILFDVKAIAPQITKNRRGLPDVQWLVKLTKIQYQSAQFLVIVTALCPERIAIVPLSILQELRVTEPSKTSEHVTLTLGYMKAAEASNCVFPPVLYPWVMPHASLLSAFDSIIYSVVNETGYRNPHTGVGIEGWKAQLSDFECMMPRPGDKGSVDAILKIHNAIKTTSRFLRLEFMATPMVGDFKIVDHTGRIFVFEHKLDHVKVRRPNIEYTVRRRDGEHIFKDHVQYDYFWTQSSAGYAFIIPRDSIPSAWKDVNCGAIDIRSDLSQFMIHFDPQNKWVEKLADLITKFGNAREPFVMQCGSSEEHMSTSYNNILTHADSHGAEIDDDDKDDSQVEHSDDDSDSAATDVETRSSKRAQMKKKKKKKKKKNNKKITSRSLALEESSVERGRFNRKQLVREILLHLQQQCCASGSGIFYWLGWEHPMGQMAFIPWDWTEQDKTQYTSKGSLPAQMFDLPGGLPIVLLTFDCWRPRAGNWSWGASGSIRARTKTSSPITDPATLHIILPPGCGKALGEALEVRPFLVPSDGLDMKCLGTTKIFQGAYKLAFRDTRLSWNDIQRVLGKFFSAEDTETLGSGAIEFRPSLYRRSVCCVLRAFVSYDNPT